MFQFDADLTTVDNGVWMDYQGSRFLIAHISNMKFQRALARLQAPHRRRIENGTMDPQISKDLICRAMADGVLLDWDKVVDAKKQTVPYTPDAGYMALSKNPEFRDFVSDVASSLANFRAVEVEEAGKS